MTRCADPHHQHDAAAILAEVTQQCESRGLRLTALRARVFELIAVSHTPAKAYDLLRALKLDHDSAAPPTVYRALEFLLEHGFVHKVESINAFVACPHPGGTHIAQFLVCDSCGNAIELDSADLPQTLIKLAQAQNFRADKLVIEVHGLCQNCKKPIPLVMAPSVTQRKSLTQRKSAIRDV